MEGTSVIDVVIGRKTKVAKKTAQSDVNLLEAPAAKPPTKGTEKASAPVAVVRVTWTADMKTRMAEYVTDHYSKYKIGNRTEFLANMKTALSFDNVNAKQMRNGFDRFIDLYQEVKKKLIDSGFGIDPEKDKSLSTWATKKCHYFDKLEEVMGTRPNLVPPHVEETTGFGQVGTLSVEENPADGEKDLIEVGSDIDDDSPEVGLDVEKEGSDDEDGNEPKLSEDLKKRLKARSDARKAAEKKTESEEKMAEEGRRMNAFVKKTLAGVKVSPIQASKSGKGGAAGTFASIMKEKQEKAEQYNCKRIKLDKEKFAHEKDESQQKLTLEEIKMTYQYDLEDRKLTMEEQKVQNDKEVKLAEINSKADVLKLEIRKMELELEMKKLQGGGQSTSQQ